jgi:hypothetical protein
VSRRPAPSMPSPKQVHRGSTAVFSTLMAVLGAILLVSTLVRGGGPLSVGVIFGVLFIAAGIGRLYVLRRTDG